APAENVRVEIHIVDPGGGLLCEMTEILPLAPAGGEVLVGVSPGAADGAGTARIVVTLDPLDEIAEGSESNNYLYTDLFIDEERGATLAVRLDFQRYGINEEVSIFTTLHNSGPGGKAMLETRITAPGGETLAVVDALLVDLPHGETRHRFIWRTGLTPPGSHRVRVELRAEPGGELLDDSVVPFEIVADIRVESSTSVDKAVYGAGEDVRVNVHLKNGGDAVQLPGLDARIRITREDGSECFSRDYTLHLPNADSPVRLSALWNTALHPPGLHHATALFLLDGEVVSESAASFEVASSPSISGALIVPLSEVGAGETGAVDFTVQNSGNHMAAGVTVSVLLVAPDTLAVAASQETVIDLSVNASHAGRFLFPTDGLALEPYWIVLREARGGGAPTTLDQAPMVIKDVLPPVLTILSPPDGAVFGFDDRIDLVVAAADDASGVAGVEFRLNQASWRPLAGSGRGRAVSLPVSEVGDGAHWIGVRGVDRAGNTRGPISVSVFVERFPPLAVYKTDQLLTDANGDGVAGPGDLLRYQVSIVNLGRAPAGSVLFNDLMDDPNLTLMAGSVRTTLGAVVRGNVPGDAVVGVDIGAMPAADAGAAIDFNVRIRENLPAGTLGVANQGQLTSNAPAPTPTDDPETPEAGDATATPVSAAAGADLSLGVTDQPDPVVAGRSLALTLTLANGGPSPAPNSLLTAPAPAGFSTPEYSLDHGAVWSPWSGALNLGELQSGESRTVMIRGIVEKSVTGPLSQAASLSSDAADPDPGNNTAPWETGVIFDPPSGWKTVDADGWPEHAWRMVWINNSRTRAMRVLVEDPIPDGAFYVAGSLGCVARGSSTILRCVYEAGADQVVYEGEIGPDPDAANEDQAANEVIITFRTRANQGVGEVRNQGAAHWDENGDDQLTADDPNLFNAAPARTLPAGGAVARDVTAFTVPVINPWGIFLFVMLSAAAAARALRRRGEGKGVI
ncbi:MAG: hypothetical protein GY859_37280, partial [Desulfobacterales bacterium]|nr:hypothetical protein [Desulfobacterales bacterium]